MYRVSTKHTMVMWGLITVPAMNPPHAHMSHQPINSLKENILQHPVNKQCKHIKLERIAIP